MPAFSAGQSHVTTLLVAWGDGDESALEQLVPLVHRALRRLAQRAMAGERANHTLQPTALVNEVYLRLVDMKNVRWNDLVVSRTPRKIHARYLTSGVDLQGQLQTGIKAGRTVGELQKSVNLEKYRDFAGYPDQVPAIVQSAFDSLTKYTR